MEGVFSFLSDNRWEYLLLVFLRVSGLVFTSPVFGRNNIPARVRAGFAASLAIVFFIAYPPAAAIAYASTVEFFMLCAKELLFGVILGFVTSMFFFLTFVAGEIIDVQIGFGMVNVLDPHSNLQVPMMGNLLNILLMVMFFLSGGHLRLIGLLYGTAERIPIGSVSVNPAQLAASAGEAFGASIILAVQIAAPVIAAALVMEAVLGVMVRTVPQLNMYVAGIPLKVTMGLAITWLIMAPYLSYTHVIVDRMFQSMQAMFQGLVPPP